MSYERSIEGFNRLLHDAAAEVLAAAKAQLKRKKWDRVILDVRWYPEGAIYTAKLTAGLPGGQTQIVDPPDGLPNLMFDMDDMREGVFPHTWYGLAVTVTPGGECETAFNYDPDCASEPAFLKS